MDNTPPLPTLPPADEVNTTPIVFKPDHSRRNRIFAIVIVLILLGAGAAVWWFVFRDKPAKQPAQNTNQQQSTAAAQHTIYVAHPNRQGSSTDIQSLDTTTGNSTTVATRKDGYAAYAEQANGMIRTLSNTATNDTDGTNRSNIVVQDDNNDPKTILSEITSNKGNTVSKTLWPSAFNADGSKVYFYERDNIANTQRIATVDEKGTVTDLITYKAADGKTGLGQFKGTITPGYVSKDEKTIYFNVHSCLNCDGPSYGDVVTYDVPSKTFQQAFIDPAYETDKAEGYWAKLSDNLFVVRSDTMNMSFDTQPYETAFAKGKSTVYLFDTRTNKATRIFQSDATHFAGTPLALSADGKTFYYYTDKIIKDAALVKSGDETAGHTFHFITDEIRAYDIAAAKTTALDLGLDAANIRPTFMTANATSYIFGTAGRTDSSHGESKEPYIVYTAPLTTPTKKKTITSTPAADIYGVTYLGFSAKQ